MLVPSAVVDMNVRLGARDKHDAKWREIARSNEKRKLDCEVRKVRNI